MLRHASRYLSDNAGKSQDSTDATTSSLLESTSAILSSADKKAPSLVFRANTGRRPEEEKYLRAAFIVKNKKQKQKKVLTYLFSNPSNQIPCHFHVLLVCSRTHCYLACK